ncbi:flavoprotein [Alkalihalobacillus alcalophilus ATCC 27647 = CGMCC 1.3604]|uniref:Flavoprotein n=1 Tax=Alkalihalobacillus alcalophilus ATCC 27647 = CGMCC 1.3604 TaxID=1218173 RepID=A0A094YVP0_ALKAL|nr:NAD(P)H:quinone oxidoreductase [Alkalihalobacillus alcalophilus]KGA97582.1 flavoprotein [Alkalihalobacillus alcalophilus ATCC 27647 = CGMCC 1.3604]MED1563372.1 NAD(P)H:quinone oxidoreductase [Alkalihalobacillus alcalophilus]THG90414.1 flavoprotein [Alkalihalobacillus alcalophilus ATCC 27647 = CGMCC 1.3604]
MAEIVVVYYSAFGHIAKMSEAVVIGANRIPGVQARALRIPDFDDESLRPVKKENQIIDEKVSHFKLGKRIEDYKENEQQQSHIPLVTMEDLKNADGIIWGFPTYLGSMPGRVKTFFDEAGQFCTTGELEGKPTALFTSAGSIHGGHEATLLSSIVPLLHLGMIFMGLPYTENPEYLTDEPIGGSSYGASTLAGPDGEREPVQKELTMAARLGERVARVAKAFEDSKPFE